MTTGTAEQTWGAGRVTVKDLGAQRVYIDDQFGGDITINETDIPDLIATLRQRALDRVAEAWAEHQAATEQTGRSYTRSDTPETAAIVAVVDHAHKCGITDAELAPVMGKTWKSVWDWRARHINKD